MEPPKDKDADRLISDENFVDLMENEYKQAGRPVDELSKNRAWQAIRKETIKETGDRSKLLKQIQMITVLAAGICAVFLSLRFFEQTTDFGQRIKGKLGSIEFQIGMYQQLENGDLVPYGDSSKRAVGNIVVPFVKAESQAVVLLVKEIGVEQYEAVSAAEMASGGEEHYFSSEGQTVAIEAEKKAETYCAVIADSMNAMSAVLSSLPVVGKHSNYMMECFAL